MHSYLILLLCGYDATYILMINSLRKNKIYLDKYYQILPHSIQILMLLSTVPMHALNSRVLVLIFPCSSPTLGIIICIIFVILICERAVKCHFNWYFLTVSEVKSFIICF